MSSVSKRLNLLLLCIIFYSANVHAQVLTDTSSLLSEEYNPRIIVIPFTKKQFDKKEDIRVVWNKDFYKRIAVTKFKEAFDKRDVSTIDFDAGIIIAEDINNRNEYKREDFEQFFIENSGADVYVVVDVDTQRRITAESGQVGLKVRLIVTAYEVATGISLSNKVCESPEFYTDDVGKLVSKAVESCAGEFIATIERKWKIDILKYGRPVMIDIGFRKGSGNSMTTTSNGIYYDAAIEKLIKENAKNGKYSIQSSAEKKLFFNNVRI
ncbi:MAG TPA: DUF6175 family protein, partial [Bacteroidia bacterium]|nr:DUF6175 family protein [Bacteroidia bacterium]